MAAAAGAASAETMMSRQRRYWQWFLRWLRRRRRRSGGGGSGCGRNCNPAACDGNSSGERCTQQDQFGALGLILPCCLSTNRVFCVSFLPLPVLSSWLCVSCWMKRLTGTVPGLHQAQPQARCGANVVPISGLWFRASDTLCLR